MSTELKKTNDEEVTSWIGMRMLLTAAPQPDKKLLHMCVCAVESVNHLSNKKRIHKEFLTKKKIKIA